MVVSMPSRRTDPSQVREDPAWNRSNNPPIGPTGPSRDHVRRLGTQRHHPALFTGKTPDPAPGPDQGPRLNPKRYRPDRHPHPLVAHKPMPPVVHDPEHDPHRERYADVDVGGDAALRIESPIRPPMRLTRDGRSKPRDFGRRY